MPIKNKTSTAKRLLSSLHRRPLTFGRMITSLRMCDGISQNELAAKLHISKAHLCDIEKGRRNVSPERAAQFAEILGYSVKQFVSRALEDTLGHMGLKVRVELKTA